MIYKTGLLTVASLVFLSGCLSLSTSQRPSQEPVEKLVQNDPAVDQSVESPQSTEQLSLVEQLSVKPNLYQMHKRELSALQRDYMVKAIESLEANNIAQGLASVSAAESNGLLTSTAYVVKADLMEANGDEQAAKNALEQALEVNQYNVKAANRLATLLRENGEFDRAFALYSNAIKAVPTYAPSYRNRGVLNDLYLLDKASALEDYETYASLLEYRNLVQQSKEIERSIKQVNRWIVDVDRQLQSIASNTHAN